MAFEVYALAKYNYSKDDTYNHDDIEHNFVSCELLVLTPK